MHRTNSQAWPDVSNHTDPGPNVPWDVLLDQARELLAGDGLDFDPAEVWAVPIP